MLPYNHNASTISEACAIDEDMVTQLEESTSPSELLDYDKRILAYVAVKMIPMPKEKVKHLCNNTKFAKNNPIKVNKVVHPELHRLIVENIDSLQKTFTENLILFSFSGWHLKVIGYLQLFYNKFSKVVEFCEINYTKEELVLLIAIANLMKEKALAQQKKIEKLTKGSKETSIKALLKALAEDEDDDKLSITYEGKDLTEEQLEIPDFNKVDKIDRDIDQNIGNPLWIQASNAPYIYGVSQSCMQSTDEMNVVTDAIKTPFNGQYTNIEIACHMENATQNILKVVIENYGEDNAMVKLLIELQYNKTDWRHQLIMHDRVSRVLFYKNNNISLEDIQYIIHKIL